MITRAPAWLAIAGLVFSVACQRDAPEEVESETVVPVTAMPAETGSITAEARATGIVVPAPGAELLVIAPEPARIVEQHGSQKQIRLAHHVATQVVVERENRARIG